MAEALGAGILQTCLNSSFDTDGEGLGTLRALRDLYMHGYGVPVQEEQHHKLAAAIYSNFSMEPATPAEVALGYEGVSSFFGPNAHFDSKTGLRDEMLIGLPAASITPLATYRALVRIGHRLEEAAECVMSGPRDDASESKFVKTVERWWDKRGGLPEGDEPAPSLIPV